MSTILPGLDTGKAAVISACGRYRYRLTRRWNENGFGIVNWLMLNPSTADAEIDDATIRRCIGFSRSLAYSELTVTNLFALRSTDPRALKIAADPVGPENDQHILEAARSAEVVICAWGAHGALRGRAEKVSRMLAEAGIGLYCLALTKGGHPGHPLYLPGGVVPRLFGEGRRP